jgi:uncharacterized tellurite resistance protein B-like protein
MSLLDLFDSQQKKINKAYLVHLIHVSKADGSISAKEKKVLHLLGHKLGFVEEEVDRIIETPGPDVYYPPYELGKRIEHIYDIVRIAIADGIITEDEHRITNNFAIAAGFDPHESEKVINLVINGIKEGKDEEDIIKEYRKLK